MAITFRRDISADQVRSIFDYDQDTGFFRWRAKPNKRFPAGAIAGQKAADGYIEIRIQYKKYYAHRLAWLFVHGSWPAVAVDHRDGDRGNNAIANLREATWSQNASYRKNVRGYSKTKSGKFQSTIYANNKSHFLGLFETEEEARVAYLDASQKFHGEFSSGGAAS